MIKLHINLKDEYPDILSQDVYLDGLLYDESFEYPHTLRKSVLVLPGGGYSFVSYREKDPVMFAFLSRGFNAFSLSYSCFALYPTPFIETACAMHYINTRAQEFHLEPNTVSLVGFSAGGHLASSYPTVYQKLWDKPEDYSLLKPYALVLAYPVISLVKSHNDHCIENISAHNEELMHLLSADEHVDKNYPPVFMWATKDDECVDHHNILWLKKALNEKKIKNQCIIYPHGPHGLSLANEATACGNPANINEEVSEWLNLAVKFIQNL
ncbi:MAG: alpha/beta hydrolase [Bacilli bacterium]|nr:alpha/beta hydrolase [Bacilli bacterium]